MSYLVVGVGLALVLAACSSGEGTDAVSTSPSTDGTDLTVEVDNHDGKTETWTLTCDPDKGSHPNAASPCNFLRTAHRWGQNPFAPVSKDQVCAEVFGGLQTATVKGVWNNQAVDAKFDLVNQCEINRWMNAIPLLVVTPTVADGTEKPQ